MSVTEPIRKSEELRDFMNYYREKDYNPRNYCLIVAGLNTALRISDILSITWDEVYDFEADCCKTHLNLQEMKTKKIQNIVINEEFGWAIRHLKKNSDNIMPTHYLFYSRDDFYKPISRIQAYRIIKQAAKMTVSNYDHIGCHSLRKTFGYFAYKNGANPILLMSIFNHSSFEITKRYLGITQDEKDSVYLNLNFKYEQSV